MKSLKILLLCLLALPAYSQQARMKDSTVYFQKVERARNTNHDILFDSVNVSIPDSLTVGLSTDAVSETPIGAKRDFTVYGKSTFQNNLFFAPYAGIRSSYITGNGSIYGEMRIDTTQHSGSYPGAYVNVMSFPTGGFFSSPAGIQFNVSDGFYSRTAGSFYIHDTYLSGGTRPVFLPTTPHALLEVQRTGPSSYQSTDNIGAAYFSMDVKSTSATQPNEVYGSWSNMGIGYADAGNYAPASAFGTMSGVYNYTTAKIPIMFGMKTASLRGSAGRGGGIWIQHPEISGAGFTQVRDTSYGILIDDQPEGIYKTAEIGLRDRGRIEWSGGEYISRISSGRLEVSAETTDVKGNIPVLADSSAALWVAVDSTTLDVQAQAESLAVHRTAINTPTSNLAYSATPTGTTYNYFHAGTDWSRATARTAKSTELNYQTVDDLAGGSYPTNLAFIGNSIMSAFRQPFVHYAKANFGLVGLGFDPLDNLGYGSNVVVTKSSTWAAYELDGGEAFQSPAGSALVGTAGDTLKYAPVAGFVSFTDMRIWYLKTSGGGAFKYHVDGAVGVDVDTDNPSDELGCVRVSGLDGGSTHYVTIDSIITGGVTLFAIETFSSRRSGIVPYWFCEGGTTSNMWTGNLSFFRAIYDTVRPAVTNIELGANDAGTYLYTAAAYKGYMNKIIDTVRAVDSCAIVLWSNYPRESFTVAGTEDAAYTTLSDEYRDSLFSIATEKGLSVWDVRKFWPLTWAEAHNANLYLDNIHPNGNGGTLLAQGLFDFLTLGSRNYITESRKPYFDFGLSVRGGTATSPAITSFGETGAGVRISGSSGFFWNSTNPAISINGVEAVRFGSDGSSNYLASFFTSSTYPGISFSRRGSSTLAWTATTTSGDEPELNSNNAAWHILRSGTEMLKIGELGTPPANASATGTAGQIVFGTDGYLYICTATNTWVRVQLSTWP